MATEQLTAADQFCGYHHIEYTFITALQEAGLIEVRVVGEVPFIPESQLPALERMVRMHQDLDINIAGIEAISHLLTRVEEMQKEMRALRNRLKMYE